MYAPLATFGFGFGFGFDFEFGELMTAALWWEVNPTASKSHA